MADCAVLQSHHASAVPLMPPQGSLRSELGLLHALVAALREEVAALRKEAEGTVAALAAMGAKSVAATEDAVTAVQASVPVVAVGAKANEDGVMDPVVVAAEKTATEAATFSEMEVEEFVEEVDDVRCCRSSAGAASADGAVDVDDCHALEVSEPLCFSAPLVAGGVPQL